ncbi:MAG: alcohol dehydrogenase catalytic domain-containing protein, partial [Myxococcota bacterium]|nr:alcohol dehydrogenase catalytic domain-containing protein [Myxococcota bacterium]
MRAVRLHEIDRQAGPQNLRVESVEDPQPGPGEILVKLVRAAFNRRDVFITQGLYPGIQLPCIPGSDGVGTVAAHGEGTQGPALGTRVVIDPTLGWG